MAVMGLISRIRGRKTALTNQADTPVTESAPPGLKAAVMQGFYEASQTTPDPLGREIAWKCYLNMRKEWQDGR